jgi:hypothetical protein
MNLPVPHDTGYLLSERLYIQLVEYVFELERNCFTTFGCWPDIIYSFIVFTFAHQECRRKTLAASCHILSCSLFAIIKSFDGIHRDGQTYWTLGPYVVIAISLGAAKQALIWGGPQRIICFNWDRLLIFFCVPYKRSLERVEYGSRARVWPNHPRGGGSDKFLALWRKQATGLKKCIYIFLSELHTFCLRCSNFFNLSKKNSFGFAANRKRWNRKSQGLISTLTYILRVSYSLVK